MKKLILVLILVAAPALCQAADETEPLDSVYINLHDKASLQRGARLFVNYCLSCHSAGFMRYNRMGRDLGISDDNLRNEMMFASDKPGDLMKVSMPEAQAKKWFGTAPPDLSLIARQRTPAWIYSYLRRFYVDPNSKTGWNNTLFHNVAMPDVLYELQGVQRLSGHDKNGYPEFELEKPGTMKPKEYDQAIQDLTNFLVYLGEPAKLVRYKYGGLVLLFLVGLFALTVSLKKEYWRDVH